ncbi:hypothetical protein J7T55_003754 [Diaporthe amygdali]|uniref:uncharacterized protein n=1 Tax=Phomopsis amygdali TaxID=1214568 RepID=UPI0022FEE455|nr:uncharacterized protein J7T55_003754 [Diaporthe amygdali]KAJ0117340.1 hypothetical protein J7T55_003754 [Diaporthe amygdali]
MCIQTKPNCNHCGTQAKPDDFTYCNAYQRRCDQASIRVMERVLCQVELVGFSCGNPKCTLSSIYLESSKHQYQDQFTRVQQEQQQRQHPSNNNFAGSAPLALDSAHPSSNSSAATQSVTPNFFFQNIFRR